MKFLSLCHCCSTRAAALSAHLMRSITVCQSPLFPNKYFDKLGRQNHHSAFLYAFHFKIHHGPKWAPSRQSEHRAQEEALHWALQAALCIPQLEAGRAVLWHQAEQQGWLCWPTCKGHSHLTTAICFHCSWRGRIPHTNPFPLSHYKLQEFASTWKETWSKALMPRNEMKSSLPKRLGDVNQQLSITTSAPRYHC